MKNEFRVAATALATGLIILVGEKYLQNDERHNAVVTAFEQAQIPQSHREVIEPFVKKGKACSDLVTPYIEECKAVRHAAAAQYWNGL
jgi:hypothetical protein